ncbi:hypothetical protein CS542_07975 [Pedobacter sp. IW39]|nr:hypothetical protein CS542_07975 [Pedobacter sp. IW39]
MLDDLNSAVVLIQVAILLLTINIDIFSRINYKWANKYIFNATVNRDGSSNFGPNKRFGTFGSAGLAWIVSEERWLKDKLSF